MSLIVSTEKIFTLFRYTGFVKNNTECSKIDDVLRFFKTLFLLSIRPVNHETNSRLIEESWSSINWSKDFIEVLMFKMIFSAISRANNFKWFYCFLLNALLFVPKRNMQEGSAFSVPQMLKDVCVYILDVNNWPEWTNNYRKIMEHLNKVDTRNYSFQPFLSHLMQLTFYSKMINLKDIQKLTGYVSSTKNNPTWIYIKSLTAHMQNRSELF